MHKNDTFVIEYVHEYTKMHQGINKIFMKALLL